LLVKLYSLRYCWLQEEGEDTGEGLRMGKRLLRSLALVFGCVAISSLVWWFLRSFGLTHGSVLWYPKFLACVTIDLHVWLFSCNKKEKRKERGVNSSFYPLFLFYFVKLHGCSSWYGASFMFFFNLYWISVLKGKNLVAKLRNFDFVLYLTSASTKPGKLRPN